MLFNTDSSLWKAHATKNHYKTLRVTPYGDLLTTDGSHVARFNSAEEAEATLKDAGWAVGQIVGGWRGVASACNAR